NHIRTKGRLPADGSARLRDNALIGVVQSGVHPVVDTTLSIERETDRANTREMEAWRNGKRDEIAPTNRGRYDVDNLVSQPSAQREISRRDDILCGRRERDNDRAVDVGRQAIAVHAEHDRIQSTRIERA